MKKRKYKKCPFCGFKLFRDTTHIGTYYNKNRYICRKCNTLVERRTLLKSMVDVRKFERKLRRHKNG